MPEGILFVIGWPRGGGGSRTQSVLFHRDLWTPQSAKRWLREHGFRYGTMEVGRDYYRFRQLPPGQFERFATIRPGRKAAANALLPAPASVAVESVARSGSLLGDLADRMARRNPISDLWAKSEVRAWYRGEGRSKVWTNLSKRGAQVLLRILENDPDVVRVDYVEEGVLRRLVPRLDNPYIGFERLRKELARRPDVRDPAALAAWIGRKKYGAKRFQKMALAGRRRATR